MNITDSGISGLESGFGQYSYPGNYSAIQYAGTQSDPAFVVVVTNSTSVLCTATLTDGTKEINYLPGDFTTLPYFPLA